MIKTILWIIILLSLVNAVFCAIRERHPFSFPTLDQPLSLMKIIFLSIHYAKAKFNGYALADNCRNQLWIRDKKSHIRSIQSFIKCLDIPIDQILIKTRIVSIDNHNLRSLVFYLELSRIAANLLTDLCVTILTLLSNLILRGYIPIIKLKNGQLLDMALSGLEQEGDAELISSPELMTNNHQTAVIESGKEIPYQEKIGEGNTSVTFKKATLPLKVTYIVLPSRCILLQLAVNYHKLL
ncbi:hypothetical protein [Coxiella-like endosymbiont]|uniref:hypothetical protein n=1 Tax=Coxiella-like endosymbiont TaxID=1592897 RepID=UPI00272C50A3|nr:hypothetical protein [Coxiella-like endosymbiont]